MEQKSLSVIVQDQTARALWEVKNVMDAVPEDLWNRPYCGMPLWKHIYHMLHSLDLWFVNPRDRGFQEPAIHVENLNNLDVVTEKELSREEIDDYRRRIYEKIECYTGNLTDEVLLDYPPDCEYPTFTLILAQFRHLHTHMGMIMGFIVADTGLWPRVLGLENPIPDGSYDRYC